MTESQSRMLCPHCGGRNNTAAKFCGDCGARLVADVICTDCGTGNDPGQRFCNGCGAPLSRSTSAPPGRVMPKSFANGRYEVARFLGEGGRKRVYLAHDTLLQREVAVSAFKSEDVDANALARARREAEAMARLGDHPNVVTIFDIGEEGDALFLVSQYMSGGDLAGLLGQAVDGRLAFGEVVRIATDVARALDHAHAHGVVHRDIKPQNVWLAPDGTAKLGDFGLAVAADRSRLTVEGTMVGTVAYMPPEQGLGRAADGRSDLYSLGTVMYESLCGVPPFVGGDAAAIISQHVSMTPVAPSWHRPDMPRALEQLVLKLLAKLPEERPQSAAEVRQALEAITSASSAVVEPSDDVTDALDRLTDGTFLGREMETKDLRAAVDEVLAGRGRVSMVVGEAGIGKTRLATEVGAYAGLRGAQVLWGRCYEGEGSPAYWPWVQVIRSYAQNREPDALVSELGSGASDVAQVVSDLRDRLPDLPEPPPMDAEHARFRLFDSITSFLRNASSARPLVIVLEDLQLADKPSLLLLQFVARELRSTRILLLGTYRDVEVSGDHPLAEVQASLSHAHGYQRVRLHGLSKREVFSLLEEVSRQTLETTDELAFAEAVYEESGGNPYFIEELIRHLVDSGAIYQCDGRWMSDAQHIAELGIPQGIRDVVSRRMARLSPECRELLAVASVIGHEFRLEILEPISELPAATVVDLIREAADAVILLPVPDEVNRYRFAQVATRDALYNGLARDRRLRLHQRIGETLEELYEDRLESHLGELAHHFGKAASLGVAAQAADYSWWAAERAVALAAYEDAVDHLERALRLFDTLPEEPTRRCELLLTLGDACLRAGDGAKARKTFLEVAEIAEPLSLSDQYARAALGFGGGGHTGSSVADRADKKVVELLRTALDGLPERDSLLRVRVLARLALELRNTRDQAQADPVSAEAVAMAERLGDARITLLAMDSRQWATKGPDGMEESRAAADEIIRLARVVGDREMEFRGHHLSLDVRLQLGDIDGVDREIRSCEKLAKELRQPSYEWQAGVFRVMRTLMQGRVQEAERLAQATFAIGQRWQPEQATVAIGVHMFIKTAVAGGMAALQEGGETFADRYPHGAWPAALTWLLSEIDEREKARARFDVLARDGFQGIRRDANWLTALSCLSWTCDYLDDAEAAVVLYDMLHPYADRCISILAGAASVGSVHLFLGNLARTARNYDAAIEHFARALEVNERIGAHFIVPRIYCRYARAVICRGSPSDRELAEELIEKGLVRARDMGLQADVEGLMALRLESRGLADIDVQTSIDAVALSVDQTRPDLRPAAAPDGTVTLMFSDIEDSTVLTEKLGDRRWFELLGKHNQIVRGQVTRQGGYEVKAQGDGFMIAFASASKAIRCAIDVQRALSEHRRHHPDEPIKIRIGLHTGEALRHEEDFFGKNVILAARIAARARGDEILISSLLHELVSSAGEFRFGDERELELKGLSGRYRVFDVAWTTEESLSGGGAGGAPRLGAVGGPGASSWGGGRPGPPPRPGPLFLPENSSGVGGIRTRGPRERTPVFKTSHERRSYAGITGADDNAGDRRPGDAACETRAGALESLGWCYSRAAALPMLGREAFRVHFHLPHGRGLAASEFAFRHRVLVSLLWSSAVALPLYSVLQGYGLVHAASHMLPLAGFGLLASMRLLNERVRAAFCALGLLLAAAFLVHVAHGVTEAHFAFFVLIVCLTLYEDWVPFLTAVAFVLLHHGVLGMIDPEAVFSGASLDGSPWRWAGIHAAFVAAAGAAAIVVWGANERLRDEKDLLIQRLSALSHEDQLTGLPNRRAWDQRLALEIARAKRSGSPLSVAMLDLDDLKLVNDRFGHHAGDQLLIAAPAAWSETVRESDFIARVGGDEFGVVFPDCDAANSAVSIQRLLDRMPLAHSASAGIATWDGREPIDALVRRADAALYSAKDTRPGLARAGARRRDRSAS